MSEPIGSLYVELAASTGRFIADLEKAQGKLGQLGKRSQTVGDQVLALGKILAAMATATVAAASSVVAITKSYANTGDELAKMADKTGVSVEELSRMRVAAALADVDMQSLTVAYRQLSVAALDAARGSKEQRDLFRDLKIEIKDGNGVMKPASVLLSELADRLSRMSSSTERAAVAQKLLGRAGIDLLPLLIRGSGALHEAQQEAEQLGVTFSTTAARAAEDFNDNLKRLGFAAEGVKNTVGAALLPVVNDLVLQILTWVKANQALIQGNVKSWAEQSAQAIAQVASSLVSLLSSISALAGGPLKSGFQLEIQGLAAIFTLLSHAIRETSGELSTFFAKMGKSDAVKKFYDDALAQGRKALDTETAKRLREIFDPASMAPRPSFDAHVQAFQSRPPTAPKGDISLSEKRDIKPAPFVITNRDEATGLAIVERTKTAHEGLLKVEQEEIAELLKRNELSAFFGTSQEEQLHQEELGRRIVEEGIKAHERRYDALESELVVQEALAVQQEQFYAMDSDLSDKASAARQVAEELRRQRQELTTAHLKEQDSLRLISAERYQAELKALEIKGEAARMEIVRQFPAFWEQQLQDIVASNAFSVSQIVSTWTSGIANVIVNGGDVLQQAWKATQVAIIQGALNTGIQLAAQWALRAATEVGIASATAASVGAINAAKNSAIIAGDTVAGGATVGIWEGVGATIVGTMGAVAGAVMGFFTEVLIPAFVAIGNAIMSFFTAIAEASSDTIFGIPYAIAILAGVAVIAAAIGALTGFSFKEGGMGNFGSGTPATLHGPEAIIPLNHRGAAFMGEALASMGMGNQRSGPLVVNVMLPDKRVLASVVVDELPSAWRRSGLPA